MTSQAFFLRMCPVPPCDEGCPGDWDCVPEALRCNQLVVGWAEADGLLDLELSRERFREVIHHAYSECYGENRRKLGAAAGNAWRFIRCMREDDLVVVPHDSEFHIGRVAGAPFFDKRKVKSNSAYRRKVEWIKPNVPMIDDGTALQNYMKKPPRGTLNFIRKEAVANEVCELLAIPPTLDNLRQHAARRSAQRLSTAAVPRACDRDGIRHGREGEGPNHRKLRCWIMRNPGKVAPHYAKFHTETEYVLRSADRVDVVFRGPDEIVVIEVKSSDSSEADLERGVFQCIKYRAVMEAMKVCPEVMVTSILVTQEFLPESLAELARQNGVRHFLAPELLPEASPRD